MDTAALHVWLVCIAAVSMGLVVCPSQTQPVGGRAACRDAEEEDGISDRRARDHAALGVPRRPRTRQAENRDDRASRD
eukprot:CAMPEP_0179848312 /NCGR_PEP_ID=MMETSP0982-20121206/6553_1 /TAXON_ID=483367 /ORGANISM="non described non described, Strain CCMP 2436" /LENGTH=77 /DNA_ID=CAMNT_0021733563 /DNA_START=697 /DNA_END=930 /DNA_ORIENTATION=+